jgi:lysophospholipase L1-like esterase
VKRLGAIVVAVALAGGAPPAVAAEHRERARACDAGSTPAPSAPGWLRQRRMTVLVDSVLLGGMPAVRRRFGCWRVTKVGRPALMVRAAERELRASRRRVDRLVVVGLGYNSLWERGRRRYRRWARRFDREAERLLATLRRRGARQVVWVTLREPTARVVPPAGRGQLGQYGWYFPYVNERLRRLDRRHDDVVLARWDEAGDRRGLTYDAIHLNPRGARLMARTIQRAVALAARRPG